MARKLDHLYNTVKLPVLSFQEADKIVQRYHQSKGEEQQEALSTLLKAWHKYFMKYVEILCGSKVDFKNRDTKEFLRLFLSADEKNPYNIYYSTNQFHIIIFFRNTLIQFNNWKIFISIQLIY